MLVEKTYPIGVLIENRVERAKWYFWTTLSNIQLDRSRLEPEQKVTPVNPISKEQLPLPLKTIEETEDSSVFEYTDHL